MGGDAGKLFSVVTFGASDLIQGKKPFASFEKPKTSSSGGGGMSADQMQAQNEAERLRKETEGKPLTRSIGRARGAGQTVFTTPLGYGGVASLAKKQLLGQ